jgi:hypothetical protein
MVKFKLRFWCKRDMNCNYICGVKSVFNELKNLKYASLFDKHLTLVDFTNNNICNAELLKQQHDNVTVMSYVLKFKNDNDQINSYLKHRVVTYQSDGLTYFAHGRILSSNNSELWSSPEPALPLFSFVNSGFLVFRFIRFDTDVFLDLRVKHQILSVIQNFVANYLTNLGLSVSSNPVTDHATISIFVLSENRNRIYNFLSSIDWYNLLSPFKHLFSKLIIQNLATRRVYDFNNIFSTELQINLYYRNSTDEVVIEIDFYDANYFKNIYESENSYDEINGWDLMPQLKPFYTSAKFTTNPVENFVIYGKVPQIQIHEKYLPIWRAGVLKVFGFKINDSEYWFKQPIYVNRFLNLRRIDLISWNSYFTNRHTFI